MAGNAWLRLLGQARVVQELQGPGEWGLVSGRDAGTWVEAGELELESRWGLVRVCW